MNEPLTYTILCLTAFVAGAINSVAGGGTLLTFPALEIALMSPLAANVTSTVALVPGSFAGAWGYRKELAGSRRWLALLAGPSLIGGLAGSLLLVLLPPDYFKVVVPWLLLTASILFMSQPLVNRYLAKPSVARASSLCNTGHRLEACATDEEPSVAQASSLCNTGHRLEACATDEEPLPSFGRCIAVAAFQFLVGVYGGYFGAGIGILTLSALGLMGLHDIHRMNALKTVLAACVNAISVIVFVFSGQVHWPYGIAMALAAIVGGYTGARVGRRLPKALVRWIVIAIGLGMSLYFFLRPD